MPTLLDYEKTTAILQEVGNEVVGDLSKQSRATWDTLQKKYRLEDAQTEPMVFLICNDNWVEFTLRYVVTYDKRRGTKTALFTKILNEVDATKGEIKFASATFHLVEAPKFNVNIRR